MRHQQILLPNPRKIQFKTGSFNFLPDKVIHLDVPDPSYLLFAAKQAAESIKKHHKISWEISAKNSIDPQTVSLRLRIDKNQFIKPQGYKLFITHQCIEITGSDPVGIFYGVQTLKQLLGQTQQGQIPCLNITDWPDFRFRGVMLDISRDKVYQMQTLFSIVDQLASWKINQLQLYTEHTFAYQGHEKVWENASSMNPEQIQTLDQFCKERFIELVPNQNSFGHMRRWLKYPEYQHLAETTEPFQTPWGKILKTPFSLAPTLPKSLDFMSGLYDQLLPNFSSKTVNVGCDETFDLGAGKSKQACQIKGKGSVYLAFLLSLYSNIKRRGYKMQFWGDIILKYPELIQKLPDDVIALDWGYEGDHPFESETKLFQSSGVPYYVCPGTSSWNSIGGRLDNMLENCRNAAIQGLRNGAVGYLLTDWGDYGHWQQLPISYPGFVTGAAFSWCYASNQECNLVHVLNEIVFQDENQTIGQVLIEVGNAYQDFGILLPNSSVLFRLLQDSSQNLERFGGIPIEAFQKSSEKLQNLLERLEKCKLTRTDSSMIIKEIRISIELMIHACKRGILTFSEGNSINYTNLLREIRDLILNYEVAWLARNRIGGLSDSLHRFDTIINEYTSAINSNQA